MITITVDSEQEKQALIRESDYLYQVVVSTDNKNVHANSFLQNLHNNCEAILVKPAIDFKYARLKTSHKALFIIEAIRLFAKRSGLSEELIERLMLTEEELSTIIDAICEDLRKFRRIVGYEMETVTIEEYYWLINEFGHE